MDSTQNIPGGKLDLYARAAATMYGIVNFDDFFKILEVYYGEGALSQERLLFYFWTKKAPDPVYYVQNELIVHHSIPPADIVHIQRNIQDYFNRNKRPGNHRVLIEKEFLAYADPFFYEDCPGTKQMERYFIDNMGLSREDAKEIVAETVFLCRTSSSPVYIINALNRRNLPCDKDREYDLLNLGMDIEGDIRQWELQGYTIKELSGRA